MQIKQSVLGLVCAGLLLAGCKKAADVPPPGTILPPKPAETQPTTAPRVVVPVGPRAVTDPASGIFLRESWTLTGPEAARLRPMTTVTTITLCQEPVEAACGSTERLAVAGYLEAMRAVARANGLADIPYHFAVDEFGRVWQLRSMMYEGECAKGKNTGNVGILILGDPDAVMTGAQKTAAVKLIGVLSARFALPLKAVVARDELVKPELPGADVKKMIGEIRKPPTAPRGRGR